MENFKSKLKIFSFCVAFFTALVPVSTVSADGLVLTGAVDSVLSNTNTGITTDTPVTLELEWTLDSLVSLTGESTVYFNSDWGNTMTLSIGEYVVTESSSHGGDLPYASFTDGVLDGFNLVWYESTIDNLSGSMWAINIKGQTTGTTEEIGLELRDDTSTRGDWVLGSFDYPTFPVVGCSGTIDAEMTKLTYDITEISQTGSDVTFTAQGMSRNNGILYYRFDLIPNYGTADYDPWTGYETLQDFSTSNTLTHTFDTAGDYILVVFTSPVASIDSGKVSIMGGNISVGGDNNLQINVLDYDVTTSVNLDDSMTISVDGIAADSGDVYYRFDLIADYGTTDYDPISGNIVTLQDFSTSTSITHTFDTPGDFILVVLASNSLERETGAEPIIGGSIHVNCE